jgi:hypothetical protein
MAHGLLMLQRGSADFVTFTVCGYYNGKRQRFVNMRLRRSKPRTAGRGRGKAADSLRGESLRYSALHRRDIDDHVR